MLKCDVWKFATGSINFFARSRKKWALALMLPILAFLIRPTGIFADSPPYAMNTYYYAEWNNHANDPWYTTADIVWDSTNNYFVGTDLAGEQSMFYQRSGVWILAIWQNGINHYGYLNFDDWSMDGLTSSGAGADVIDFDNFQQYDFPDCPGNGGNNNGNLWNFLDFYTYD